MKVFVTQNNYRQDETAPFSGKESSSHFGWYLIADSAVTNTGKPFYLPDDLGRITVSVGAAFRMTRLGKTIAPKFGSRYYSEIAPVVHFQLPDYRERLKVQGLSWDPSVNFDKSLFVGDFRPVDRINEVSVSISGHPELIWNKARLIKDMNEVLALISQMNTIKMGDFVIPGLNGDLEVKEGDLLNVLVNGESDFQVKIK